MVQGQDPERLMLFGRILSDPLLLPNASSGARAIESGWVSIGTDTGYRGLEDCSIVGHPVMLEGWNGHLGVLGPMGMNYGHALQLATQCAEALQGLLIDLKRQADPRDATAATRP